MVPSGDIKARLLAAVQAKPSPTRAAQRRLGWALVGLVAVVVGVEFLENGGFKLGARPVAFAALTSLAWCLSIAALLWGLRGRGSLAMPAAVLWALALGGLAFPFAVGLVGNELYPATAVDAKAHPGFVCLELSLAMSTLPLTAWVFVRRGSDPVSPVALGAGVGALAGCISGLLVNLTCPFASPRHIALGHLLPSFVAVGVGALMGGLVLSLRAGRSPRQVGAVLGAALGAWAASLKNYSFQCTSALHIDESEWLWLVGGIALGAVLGTVAAHSLARRGERT